MRIIEKARFEWILINLFNLIFQSKRWILQGENMKWFKRKKKDKKHKNKEDKGYLFVEFLFAIFD